MQHLVFTLEDQNELNHFQSSIGLTPLYSVKPESKGRVRACAHTLCICSLGLHYRVGYNLL